ncbi:hypothetical protein OTU49_011659, partial [Cherax quadricarinatus]
QPPDVQNRIYPSLQTSEVGPSGYPPDPCYFLPHPSPPHTSHSPVGTQEGSACYQQDTVVLLSPSAPPSEDTMEDMWCRTCEEPARHTCALHHLTPLLKGEELEWIEREHQQQQQQQEKLRREEEENKQRRKEEHQKQIKQEEEDLELAVKLTFVSLQDSNDAHDNLVNPQRQQVGGGKGKGEAGQPLDLSHWTYAQIRDVINTSCNPQLLKVCHREFDRRRHEYHRT